MSFDKQIVEEINKLRTDPKNYAEKVKKYISYFNGRELKIPGRRAGLQTQEGAKAYQEAVDFLLKQSPLMPFEPSRGLFRSAKDFLKKIQFQKQSDPYPNVDKMIEKYGISYSNFVSIDYGGDNIEQSVINLIVGDGDHHRKERRALLSKDYKLIGAATGRHQIYRTITVIFTCSKFENSYEEDDIGFLDSYSAPKMKKRVTENYSQKGPSLYQPKSTKEVTSSYKYQPQSNKDVTSYTYAFQSKATAPIPNRYQAQNRIQPLSSNSLPQNIGSDKGLHVVRERKMESYALEDGKRVKYTNIEKFMSDGSKQVQTIKSDV